MESVVTAEVCDFVTTRHLSKAERPYQSGDWKGPLVIEPKPGFEKHSFLCEFLSTCSESVVQAIYENGAVLLRGFDIPDGPEATEVSRSIKGIQSLNGYFMEERGRVPIKGSTSLFHTNRFVKTGGSFRKIGGIHGENYHHADVPAIQSLWCREAPPVGGETAVVQMADVYDELSPALRARLEQNVFDTHAVPVSDIAGRYEIPESLVESLCAEVRLAVVSKDGQKFAVIRKPSVFRHPYTKRLSLQVSPSANLAGFDEGLRKELEPHYRSLGWKWTLHRLGWRSPIALKLLLKLEKLKMILADPAGFWARLNDPYEEDRLRMRFQKLMGKQPKRVAKLDWLNRVGKVVTREDAAEIGRVAAKHLSVFTWRRGDFLFWDNITTNHAGMPGMGRRSLITTLYNAIPLNFGSVKSGVGDIPFPNPEFEAIGARFARAARELHETPPPSQPRWESRSRKVESEAIPVSAKK